MAELHSITGLFQEDFPGISPWGGFILRGIHANPDGVEGMLADAYGVSRIAGFMRDKNLEFRKQYENCNHNQSLDYELSLKDGLWLGEYKSTISAYNGRVTCKTNLVLGDLSFKKYDISTPEGWAKALIESMIETGKLVEFKDPKTGEDLIEPTS